MPTDPVGRFLAVLEPHRREAVAACRARSRSGLRPPGRRSWVRTDELDTLDELSPPAAEAEAARRVMDREG